jgi:hypothetical protein
MLLLTAGISSIKLVRILECWNVLLSHWFRVLSEVCMIDGIDGIDTLSPVEPQELFEKILAGWADVTESFLESRRASSKILDTVIAWERPPSWHGLVCGGSDKFEDYLRLVEITGSCEDGLALEHFSEDASSAPHIDRRGITAELEEQFRWAIPTSDD